MDPRKLYIDLLKRCLANTIYEDTGIVNFNTVKFSPEARQQGGDWPSVAHTMIGSLRLDNLQYCVETALSDRIAGDLIETGVWRGGASILMRGILKAYSDTTRTVWVADSFEGLPPPKPELYPQDSGDTHHTIDFLRVDETQVRENFKRYDLLDDQVKFLPGWFCDTLPNAKIEKLAVARLDGDMYESTMDALNALYHKVSIGGFLIIDDFGAIPSCKQAVSDFRSKNGITEEIVPVDWTGVYWRKIR